jgi:hypothetical protein
MQEEEEEYVDSTELEEYEKIEIKFDKALLFGEYRASAKPVSSVTFCRERIQGRDMTPKYPLEKEEEI